MARKPRYPAFFKFLAPGFTKRLSLPLSFCMNLREKKWDRAVIESCLGSWLVKVGKRDDGVLFFGEGWKEFVKHHCLKLAEFLVIEHIGDMVFNVVAYESLGSEKEYPSASRLANCRMTTSSEMRSGRHHEDSKGKIPLEATTSSNSRTRFKMTMTKSHEHSKRPYMTIPAQFARSSGLSHTCRLILKGPSGKSWSVSLTRWECRYNHRIATRTKDWKMFYKGNNLKTGDVCVFNLKRISKSSSECVIDVQITRCGSLDHQSLVSLC